MAGHIWNVKKLQPTTIQRWKFLFLFAQKQCGDYQLAGEWASYRLERERQGCSMQRDRGYILNRFIRSEGHELQWESCVRSGHQYRNAGNSIHYRAVMDRILGIVVQSLTITLSTDSVFGVENKWQTEMVRSLADSIICANAWDRLPILADALEEAGCDDNFTLTYLRSFSGSTLETV